MRKDWLWILVVAGLLAGCNGGSQLPLGVPGAPGSGAATRPSSSTSGVQADRRKRKLVYISDFYASSVDIYKWESTKLVATISTGLEDPQGMCNGRRHVWIANSDGANLPEYAAGGTSEIGSLSDPGYYPITCSFDPTTGNVAVANIFSTSDSAGNVVIYAHASGSGTAYTVPNISEPYFLGYDNKGDLFVDGHPTLFGSGFAFAELAAGSSSFKAVTLNKVINFPGEIQWDGSYVATQDQEATAGTIDRFKIAHYKGSLEGTVQVSDCASVGWWILRSTLVCGGASNKSLDYYAYPAGGVPLKTEAISGGNNAVMAVEYRP